MKNIIYNSNTLKGKKDPWDLFILKSLIVLTTVLSVGYYLTNRYHIGIDDQVTKCLPPYTFFLIDRHDKNVSRGDIVAFHAERIKTHLLNGRDEIKPLAPRYEDGKIIIKQITGVPGDIVHVDHEKTSVNGEVVGRGLALAGSLNRDPMSFVKDETVPENSYWFMGKTDDSFDSRYWGYVYENQIIGRVIPLY